MRIEIEGDPDKNGAPDCRWCPLNGSCAYGHGCNADPDECPGRGEYELVPVAEVEGMRKTISDWQSCGDRIMEAVTGKAAPLSDSDVIGEVAALRAENERLKSALKDIARPPWLMRTTDGGVIVRCTACRHRAQMNGREMEQAYEDIRHSDICPVAIARAALEGKA